MLLQKLVWIFGQEYTFTLAAGFRLNDESFITFVADELLELFEVVW